MAGYTTAPQNVCDIGLGLALQYKGLHRSDSAVSERSLADYLC
jgi:hypothetical protein